MVIPAYNEAARLPRTLSAVTGFLSRYPSLSWEILVVDNGSTDGTGDLIWRAAAKDARIRPVRLERRGKGFAVRAGVLAARGEVVVFADADRSWPLEALIRFPARLRDGTEVVIGSREGARAQRLGEPAYRHLMGRVFNRLVQVLAVPGIEDTQCGFKVFRADAARELCRRQRLGGFAFDVELLYLARTLGYGVLEEPLLWEHDAHSRVRPVRDALAMLRDVLLVRWYGLRGRYEPTPPRRRGALARATAPAAAGAVA
ncbi:MAG TPA: dolichyl-phosphate beta-glucosyltransferase [Chloroflexota bacterium]|nr:dolichyl-phosphate beta-glucosyltransferase [Chloroflexota bacterium]